MNLFGPLEMPSSLVLDDGQAAISQVLFRAIIVYLPDGVRSEIGKAVLSTYTGPPTVMEVDAAVNDGN